MTAQACPGGCNSRYWRDWRSCDAEVAEYDPLDPSQSRPAPPDDESLIRAYGNPVWCTEDTSAIRLALAELDDLSAVYAAVSDGQRGRPVTQRVGGTAVVLSQSEAHDQLDELTSVITGWEQAYRDLMGWLSAPPRESLARVQTSCLAWLMRHLDDILESELAADFGREILDQKRLLTGWAKAGQRTILLEARCPGRQCGLRMLNSCGRDRCPRRVVSGTSVRAVVGGGVPGCSRALVRVVCRRR